MGRFDTTKATINANIKKNGNQEITGSILNSAMTDMVDATDEQLTKLESLVNNYKPIVINGDVTNAPDEEDITSEDNLLKLKDRSALNGMGYVILRKNKSFAEQVTKENTVYEIRYDFDLNGARVSVPNGCVLDFQGGSLRNGNIDISNGSIVNDSDNIIFNNAYVRTNQIKTSWFDNVDFANLLNGISGFNSVVVEVDKDVYLSKGVSLCNNAHLFSKTNNKISHNYMAVQDNCLIDGITFDGASSISIGLWIKGSNVRISNCMFVNYKSQDNVTVVRCGNAEDSAPTIEQVFIENNIFDNFGSTNENAVAGSGYGASRAIYVYSPSKDIYIRNNVFRNIIGEADSDYIFIMADNTLNNNEHFPSHTDGAYKFGSIPTIIDGNVFYDALVSSIKLQASDIIISNNKMICSKVNAKRGQYLLFRAHNCYNVNVINNSCHSKYRIGAIECLFCKDIVVDGCNIVMEEPSLMIENLLDCYQSESLTLKNISVKATYNNTSHWNNQSILHISGVRDFKASCLDIMCDTIPTFISAYKDNIMGEVAFKNCKFRVTSRNDNYWILSKSSYESKLIIEDCDFVDDSTEGTSVGTWKSNNIYIPISITNSSIPKMSILNEAVISKSTINQDVDMFAEGALRIYDCNLKSSKVVTMYGGDLYVNGLNIDEVSNFIFDIKGYNSVELHDIYLNKSETLLYLENVCKTPNSELLSGIKWGKQRVPIYMVNFGLESQAPTNRAADFEYECTDTGGFYKGANLVTNKCNNTYRRPTGVGKGTMYFDTDLGKPIWWQGSIWVDATGTEVPN